MANAGLLENKSATSYPGILENVSDASVVKDGLIITSKGPATAMEFALELIEILVENTVLSELDGQKLAQKTTDELLEGTFGEKSLGRECAGTVVRVGSDVAKFKVGDKVIYTNAINEKIEADVVVSKPDAQGYIILNDKGGYILASPKNCKLKPISNVSLSTELNVALAKNTL